MAIKIIETVRNAMLDAIETSIGASGVTCDLISGPVPATVDEVIGETNIVLAIISLPANWMAAASGGAKAMAGTWEQINADQSGTATFFRITVVSYGKIQGTVTATGGGGDMELTNNVIVAGQKVEVTKFTLTAGNA